MFECPHCGEPLDDDARSCPHCGSDDETGWNPDVDYFSVELPEDGSSPGDGRSDPGGGTPAPVAGRALVLASVILFAAVAAGAYGRWALLPIAFVVLCIILWWIGTRHRRRE